MTLNLILDAWIPVRRQSGTRETIAPWQLTHGMEADPIVGLDAPRPDFNGAFLQFLVGLLQTVVPPNSEQKWKEWFLSPPDPDTLLSAYKKQETNFNLTGEGPRFMQDLELAEGTSANLAALLMETPGGNTERNNADLFIKRGGSARQCPTCLAIALFTLQTNAPSGGVGHRTSIRGGGPLTTIIQADSLWRTAWINVLPENAYNRLAGDPDKKQTADTFPWMAPCRTSEKKTGKATTPMDVHPLQMYWAMPRRIRVNTDGVEKGICEVCGQESPTLFANYITKNYGTNYEGAWQHPLSPYGRDKDGMPIARHPQPGGLVYRHWLGLVVHDKERDIRPAAVVSNYLAGGRWKLMEELSGTRAPQLWCFGYDFDNMKARCWYESRMPLIHIRQDASNKFSVEISRLVNAAEFSVYLLRTNLKKSWYKSPSDAKGDLSMTDSRFWQDTEGGFYALVEAMAQSLESGQDTEPLRHQWLVQVRQHALSIFDDLSQGGRFNASDPKRVALARRDLSRAMYPKSKKMANLLALSQAQQAA